MLSTNTVSPHIIPTLKNGDRLTRPEFERRYQAMTQLKKAELIAGVVYIAAAVRAKNHGKPHANIIGWLTAYEVATPGVETLDNTTVRLDGDSQPQPDALLRIETGGQSSITEDGYLEGVPELIVEIAASTASYDLHEKLKVYRHHGVQEYIIWRVYDVQLDWFRLTDGEYLPLESNQNNIFCSQVFPGLWLDKNALLSGNLAEVLAMLQQGIASQEHQIFCQTLANK
ncbi:MAG: Uma2 family endonuclease [Microcystis sp.]|uniref:Uma2 family endonuclease n=1 Tax=Microcystis sp. TaxID=1127 RepID=UPI0039194E5B